MKIRNDYVSNSSSSSFIIGGHEIFDHFHVTKEDILEALIEAYGREAYEKVSVGCRESAFKYQEFNSKKIKYNDFGPIYVYDLENEDDRNQAIDMWGNLLDDWDAVNCHRVRSTGDDDGEVELGSKLNVFDAIIEGIAHVYHTSEYGLRDLNSKNIQPPTKFIRSNEKDPNTGMYGHNEPLDVEVIDFVKNLRHTCGIMTNLDVLKAECSKFFIHADDNELPTCTDGDEWDEEKHEYRSPEYTSDGYTYDRVCEIIYNYLVKKGRINPTQEDFLKEMEIDPKYLTKYDIDNDLRYNFHNGKCLGWEDLRDASLTWCMHEG